jgi:transposase
LSQEGGCARGARRRAEIAAVEQLIAEALSWAEIKRLMTVPGVNVIVAATFMAAVGDIRRFADRR